MDWNIYWSALTQIVVGLLVLTLPVTIFIDLVGGAVRRARTSRSDRRVL